MKDIKIPQELVLNGTDNNGKRHRYSFDKTPQLKEGLIKLFISFGFDDKVSKSIGKIFTRTFYDDNEVEKVSYLTPEEIVDRVFYFKNEEYEIDLFFGKEKVILLIRVKENREKLVEEIEKKSRWISEEEKAKRLKENGELFGKKQIEAKW